MSSLASSEFTQICLYTLEKLYELLEDKYPNIDAELQDGVLEISAGKNKFVINKHEPSKQIWYSSTVSGARRFNYLESSWVDNGGNYLEELLLKELDRK